MPALTAARNTPEQAGNRLYRFPIKAGATIHAGGLTVLDANGDAQPGAVATTLTAAGRAETGSADNPAFVNVRRGVFRWGNSAAGDAITAADWGKTVFVVDDQTVAKTNGGSTRSAAGICRGVDAAGVWVET
ncbi:MAG: hypothetical protein K2X49_06085 [Acetobacteraceae bacterium]|nr:hypothetical protein [Acetobacteraceae bacterium]